MTDPRRPLRVLMVGAGSRVLNNFLPALHCLAPDFSLVGIQTPTPTRRDPLAKQWGVPSYSSLDQVNLSGVDIVAISVPTSQNAAVLRKLKPSASTLMILIDTPIAWSGAELAACNPLLSGFKHVAVAEDYMNFAPFSLMRRAMKAGLIGTPKALTLTNTGYLYHGLALIRSFADFKPVKSGRRHLFGGTPSIVDYRVGGLRAAVIGPYRQHTTGGVTIEGTEAIISEFEADRRFYGTRKPVHLLRPIRSEDRVVGYEIDAGSDGISIDLPYLDAMRALDFPDKSDLNLLRGGGLMDVFRSFRDSDNINRRYTARQALYDSIVSRMAVRGSLPFDPFVPFGSDGFAAILLAASLRWGHK